MASSSDSLSLPRFAWVPGLLVFALCLSLFAFCLSASAATDDRTIVSVNTSPDNTFDNALIALGSDSGTYVSLDVSNGGAVANEDPDIIGGYRVEFYDASGNIVRRRISDEVNTDPTGAIQWNGQGDSNVNDTLPYGAYTLRAYLSMRDPTIPASIKGSGTTIDRPGDLHVSSGGILSWTNTGTRLSFCQVSLGDPNNADPIFMRLVDFPTGFGSATSDQAYGIVMNSANEVFVSNNSRAGGHSDIAKYSTATDTWISQTWATEATTGGITDEEYGGLGIDDKDSIYVACATGLFGGGTTANPAFEGILRFRDDGATATMVDATADQGKDQYDAAPVPSGTSFVYGQDRTDAAVDRFTNALGASSNNMINEPNGDRVSLWVVPDGQIYVSDRFGPPDRFYKYSAAGVEKYNIEDDRIEDPSGICVWQRAATGETFVIVASRRRNQIVIYKENTLGTSATFVRTILDDVYNLSTPVGLAVDADSAIFVVNQGNRSIKKFSKDGIFMPLLGAANGLFIQGTDGTGDPNTGSTALIDTQGFHTPSAVAVDAAGYIYVFDRDRNAEAAIKRFSSSGVPDSVVWMDLDRASPVGADNWGSDIPMAVCIGNNLYAVSREANAPLFRININNKNDSTWVRNVAPWNFGRDGLAFSVAPFFDRGTNQFYPSAVYVYSDNDRLWIFPPDLSNDLYADLTYANPVAPGASNVTQPFLVDNAGELYMAIDDGSAPYNFRRYNSATPERQVVANGHLGFDFTGGSAAGQLNKPRQMVWTDAIGAFKKNPITNRYEQKIWVNDSANNRLQQILVEWNDVMEVPITIALSQDTPFVSSAAVSSETIATIGGTFYVGVSVCTVQINFNKAMVTAPNPDTLTIQIKPTGGSFTTVNQLSYTNATWTGTTAITAGMADGEVIIKVENAYDNSGNVRYIVPNPDQTDFDVSDDFKPFVIDKTGPVMSVTSPPTSGDSTSAATYTVIGQVTSEVTGLDATIQMANYPALSGGIPFDVKTITASASDGSFSASLNLRSPAPMDNFIEVVAVDKLGNRTMLSPRRLIQRVKNVGTAFIEPSTETTVGALRRYVLTYTAAQTLTSDTLKFTIPAAWSAPQKTAATTNGYGTVSTGGTYTDSVFSGQTVTINGLALGIGQTCFLNYGDTVGSANGAAGSTIDAPLDDVSNTFQAALMQAGETTFTAVTAPTGKSLIVPLRDSALAVTVTETGPGGASILIAKGSETKVMVFRISNSNMGAHVDRVTQIVFSVESDTGAAVKWSNTASRVVLKNTSEGITFADVTSMPASQTLNILPAGLTVDQGLTRDVEIYVTMGANATVDTARFFFSGPAAFTATDDVSGKSIQVLENGIGVTNRKTGLYDLIGLAPADTLSIGADTSFTPADVATGQIDVGVMDLYFTNEAPGVDTPVNASRIERVVLSVRDGSGASLIPGRVLKGIHLRDATSGFEFGGLDTPSLPNGTNLDTVQIELSGLSVTSGGVVTARVWVDIADDTAGTASSFRIRLTDTRTVTAKDNVTQATMRVRDDPARGETLIFQTNAITIQRRARVGLASITLMRTDSSIITHASGKQIVAGSQFFVALNCTAAVGRSALHVIPTDTDLKLTIGGVDKTSEFTISSPAAVTIAAGGQDTLTYSVVQNLGSSTGIMTIQVSDTGADTRPRFFDNHDYFEPDKLRAELALQFRTDTLSITGAALVATALTLDTTYANPGETAVPILFFSIRNNQGSSRRVDSVVVEAISADSAVKLARLYRDNRNGVLNRSDSAAPIGSLDTLVATGTLAYADSSVTLVLSPTVTIAALGTETFFVAFDFDNIQTDGDAFDARVPANGLRVGAEAFFPTSSFNSGGEGRVEVVVARVTVTPDTQIVAVGASPTVTLKAVDAYGNLDNVANVETSVQGRILQVQATVTSPDPDTTHAIISTSGMTGVTPAPGAGVASINGSLSNAQGVLTIRDTEAETVAISVASTAQTGTGAIQFANLISASAVSLVTSDSARPDSRAVTVLAIRVTNQSGANEKVATIGIRSLNAADANVSAVILFKDLNGNGTIDSGTDQTIATGNFSGGFVAFNFLDVVPVEVFDQDSILLLVGYDIATAVTDWNLIDAQADTVTIFSTGEDLAKAALNSTPNRRIDVKAVNLKLTPTTATNGTGVNVTVAVAARDSFANVDRDYTGGATKLYYDLTLSAQFNLALTTMTNIEHPVGTDATQIKGNLVQGQANLVFFDNVAETTVLSNLAAVGIAGPHDTGSYVFQQGMLAVPLAADQKFVDPGDTNVVLLAFKVSATGVSDSLASFKFNWQGTDTREIRNVRLFRDMNADDTFTLASDTPYGVARSFNGETITFVALYANDTPYISNGTTRSFFLVVDIADTAVGGDTLDVQYLVGSITTQGNIPNVPFIIRNSPGYCTVARVPDTFRIGQVVTSNRQASEDQTEIIPMTLRFSSPNVADRKFYVETFAIMVEGPSGGRAPNTVIARAQLRNQATGIVYADKVGIESSGDSMVFTIRFDSANPMRLGGTTAETITVDVVLTIAASVTQNDTFRLRVNALDTTWARVFDHPLSTVGFSKQKNNVAVLSPSTLPLLGSVVTVQKKAIVTQTAIRITDVAGADINYPVSLTQGDQFKVEVGLAATAGRADAQVQSRDTDLTFKRANGTVDITSEFTVVSRTHSSLTTIAAGAVDTVTYTVSQGAPFSGAGETLVINNYLLSDTGPYTQDINSTADAVKLRVYLVETSGSTDAVRIDSSYVSISAGSLVANDIAPDSKGTRIFSFRVTDGGPRDTMTGIRVHLVTSAAASMIKSCWIAIDTNKNGSYDSVAVGGDTYFGTVKDFKSSDTIYFTGIHRLYGAGDTREFWVVINLETSPVIDSTQIKVEIPINGLGFQGQDSSPKTVLSNTPLFRTIIVATKLKVTPDSQTVSAGAPAVLTINAQDSYGNLNTRTTSFAQVTTNCLIKDTWTPVLDKSARWTATTFLATTQDPDPLPSAIYYDTLVIGKLTLGAATVSMTDTQSETVAVVFSAAGITGDTVRVAFSSSPTVTAVALSNLSKISPDSTNAVILQFDVSHPFVLSNIDSIYLVSENTFDTAMKRLRLWADLDGNGLFSAASDSNVDTATWSGPSPETAAFLIGGKNFVKSAATSSIRFFVTAQMETSPQTDNDSIGCRIETAGVRLSSVATRFPVTGELDSIQTDTQNAVIDVDAIQTGGVVRFIDPGQQNKDLSFTVTVRAEDKYGNLDRVFTTLGTASRDIALTRAPAGFTFNSTSMTMVSGWPGIAPHALFRLGEDTINITPTIADTFTLTATVTTHPPADTSIVIVVVAGGWSVTARTLTDSQFLASDTGVILSTVVFKNLDVLPDTLVRIDIADIGNFVSNTGIASVALWLDSNANGVFDTGPGPGTDSYLGATTFTAVETAAFNIRRPIASLQSETYFIVATIAATPAGSTGDTIKIRYSASSCSTVRAGLIPTNNVTHVDSLAFNVPSVGDITGDSFAVPAGNFTSGAHDVRVGWFYVKNTRVATDSVQTIVVKNDTGAHPDTGLRVRIVIDGNKNGAFDGIGIDTPFGAPGVFTNRVFSKTDSARIGNSGESVYFLVLFDLADTLTVDSQVLKVYIDTGGITTFAPVSDTAGWVILRSPGNVRTRLNVSPGGESILVTGGVGVVNDTVFVSVAVRDTFGSPMQGRVVTLSAPGATILTANPYRTDTQGYAQFGITRSTVGVTLCTVTVDTFSAPPATPASIGYANFLSTLMVGDTQFTSNTQHGTNTGPNQKHLTAPSFDPVNANDMAYGYYNNSTYTVYKVDFDVSPTPASLYSSAGFPGMTITAPAPDWASNVRVRNLKGAAEAVIFGGFSSDLNYGVNLYSVPYAGGAVTRVSPNDKRGISGTYLDTDAEFGQFDVSPTGETIVACFTGQLAEWNATGASFNPEADSTTLRFLTTLKAGAFLTGGYQWNGAYIQYPSWSPDGNRIAFTVVYRNNAWAGPSDTAEIFVLYNLGTITRGTFPFSAFGSCTSLPAIKNAHIVKVVSSDSVKFAWQPQWSRDGSVLFFSGNDNLNFDYEVFTQTVTPEQAIGAAGVDFNTYMIYYDKAAESAPYRPIRISGDPNDDEIIGEMSSSGDSLAIMRSASTVYEEVRTVRVASQANVTANGGILFDSGRVSVVVRENESFGNGFTIASHSPDTPTGENNDSIIISGVAKRFFNPDTPTAPVYFPDSVAVFLYYKRANFADSDLLGFDFDGDGIPDRTENSISAYYWDGSNWIQYPTVRFPAENKIQFWTTHFSEYAIGMSMQARALAFTGAVQDVVAYPNPWRADGPTAGVSSSDPKYGIKLTNFPGGDVRVRIFTIAGELLVDGMVNALNNTTTSNALRVTTIINNTRGTVSWNLANQRDRAIASGVYLIILDGPGGRAVRKVAVIR